MTTLIQPTTEQKVDLLRERFHSYGWKSKQVHRSAHVYLVYKPNHREHCYFIAFYSDGAIKLLPSDDKASESYQEVQQIIDEVIR